MKILMVCLGNICRSPLAEGILQEKAFKAGLNWTVESAGTNGYHNGETPHHLSQKVARQNGIDISTQRSRKLKAEDFELYDKMYAMANDVVDDMRRIAGKKFDTTKVDLLLNELHPGKNRDVPDPWYGAEPGYHEVYKLIDEACDAIIQKYTPTTKGALEPQRINSTIDE
jgi:protein-tyrosine phosphatase